MSISITRPRAKAASPRLPKKESSKTPRVTVPAIDQPTNPTFRPVNTASEDRIEVEIGGPPTVVRLIAGLGFVCMTACSIAAIAVACYWLISEIYTWDIQNLVRTAFGPR